MGGGCCLNTAQTPPRAKKGLCTFADTSRDESQKQICWVFIVRACKAKYIFQIRHRRDPVNTFVCAFGCHTDGDKIHLESNYWKLSFIHFMASRVSYEPEGNNIRKNPSKIQANFPSTASPPQFGEQEYSSFETTGFEEIRFFNPMCFICSLRESLMGAVKTKQTYETAVFAFKQTLIDRSNE